MKTLEEVQAQFESKNKAGNEVNILAYHPGQEYPIIAQVWCWSQWQPMAYKMDGSAKVADRGGLIKKRSVLPKDILCEVWHKAGEEELRYSDGEGGFFQAGANSLSTNGNTADWPHYRVIENPPQPWFGGECPIPEGCEFRVRVNGSWFPGEEDRITHSWELVNRITAYQILGEKVSK